MPTIFYAKKLIYREGLTIYINENGVIFLKVMKNSLSKSIDSSFKKFENFV